MSLWASYLTDSHFSYLAVESYCHYWGNVLKMFNKNDLHSGDIQVIIGIISKLSLLGIVDKVFAFDFHSLVGEIYLPSLM